MLQPDEMASYVSVDGQLIARIVLRDVPRANTKTALANLHELGVTKLAMLTGDKRASAMLRRLSRPAITKCQTPITNHWPSFDCSELVPWVWVLFCPVFCD